MCATCGARLWSCFQLSNGQPVVAPIGPTVPFFREGEVTCPYCETPFYIEFSDKARLMFRDENDGYVRVA
jgi:hypothetical protein